MPTVNVNREHLFEAIGKRFSKSYNKNIPNLISYFNLKKNLIKLQTNISHTKKRKFYFSFILIK